MGRNNRRFILSIAKLLTVVSVLSPHTALASGLTGTDTSNISTAAPNELKHYLGAPVNTGKDNGYSKTNKIVENDPHFGWQLGDFFVTGYTRVAGEQNGKPVFLKTVGDKVALWFHLNQDINHLNGGETLTIHEDANGYDEYFGVEKTNFGRGTLIIRHTDHQNLAGKPLIYTNYLVANARTLADTQVQLFEEGDYEVALNYEVKSSPREVLGQSILPGFTNYRIFFRFSVRNGNSMVYPFDVVTKNELTNSSVTENGFYLDLAKSRYLNIDIKKEVLKEGANGLTEDVRFNRPAKDGDEYTEEGIYTISVKNRYTDQETVKKIYVGKNDVLKANVTTGLSIEEIEKQLELGARIASDGTIIPPPVKVSSTSPAPTKPVLPETQPNTTSTVPANSKTPDGNEGAANNRGMSPVLMGAGLIVLIGAAAVAMRKRKPGNVNRVDSNGSREPNSYDKEDNN